jgi:hypothetical protein
MSGGSVSTRIRRHISYLVLLLPCSLAAVSCLVSISSGVTAKPITSSDRVPGYQVTSPVKAHLLDGSTVVYADGIVVRSDHIAARKGARRYGVLNEALPVSDVPLDSIVGLESYERRLDYPASFLLSTVSVAGTLVATAALAIAIFGSCPTVYADSAGVPVLQAEVFARRISPLLEARDIDLLHARPDSAGVLTLEVRNEALETHYINHFELLEVRHARGRRVIPDEHGRPLIVGSFTPPTSARDRAGRDVRETLARADGNVFSTDSGTLSRAGADDPGDHIDFTVPRPSGDSAVVGLRLRSSLLNTVLLYDMMLAGPGARSLDWLERDMRQIGPMLQFANWHRKYFGLRVSVWDGKAYREIERHPEYGPVAWREAATVVPVLEQDSLRVRLSFTADEWRIDWVGVAPDFWRPRPRLISVSGVRAANDSVASVVARNLRSADERYVQTSPGERFWVTFATGPAPRDSARTFLLASQGYYSEWLRPSWIQGTKDTTAFVPSAASLATALHRWSTERDSLDKSFFSTRIPMREP